MPCVRRPAASWTRTGSCAGRSGSTHYRWSTTGRPSSPTATPVPWPPGDRHGPGAPIPAHQVGRSVRVFSTETRPLLQGSRLTAWELDRAGIDVTVITDNMAGALFGELRPDSVFVGADRIAANGDVANKVGTYAWRFWPVTTGVPFYVLAPTSTVDLGTSSGADIPIEFRGAEEVARGFGSLTAPSDAQVWSPAFDITPASLVSGIVTEHGDPHPPAGRSAGGGRPQGRRRTR